jgi:ABC-type multidrug transport system fused ATPase/permease subunit
MLDSNEEEVNFVASSEEVKQEEMSTVLSNNDSTKKDGEDGQTHASTKALGNSPGGDQGDDEKQKENNTLPPSAANLFPLGRRELPMIALSLFIQIGEETTGLITPLILAWAYDTLVDPDLSDEERLSEINRFMVLIMIVSGVGIVMGFTRGTLLGLAGERIVARLRNQLYASILSQEIAFFDANKSGELVSRLGSDTSLVQTMVSQALPETLLGVMKVVVSLALMFWISPKLAGMTVGLVVVLMAFSIPIGILMSRLTEGYQNALGQAQTHSTEAFGAMRTVQSFAAEEREALRFRRQIGDPDLYKCWWPTNSKNTRDDQEAVQTTYSMGAYKAATTAGFYTFVFGCGFGGMYLTLWYGFHLVTRGEMTIGELTAFQSYVFTIGFSLGFTSASVAQVFEGLGASGRILYLLYRTPLIPAPTSRKEASDKEVAVQEDENTHDTFVPTLPPQKPESMEGVVEFHNVNFEYPTRTNVPVLRDFTLTVPANTTAALVGSSGAGKSTVVALLQRFYEVSGGSIRVDGIDVRNLDLKWLRNHIGYVQQEPQLFGMTVRQNVMYGVNRDVTQEEIEQACRNANAHDFVVEWPNGYDTLVGERGVKLSGGQKQRLAIARALLTNCRILLLDEATSALDAESEHLVQEAIDKAVEGRTVLIVAHRLSTIRRASQIVVMDQQRIVDVGNHDELWDRCARYVDLIKRQQGHVT